MAQTKKSSKKKRTPKFGVPTLPTAAKPNPLMGFRKELSNIAAQKGRETKPVKTR